MPERKTVLVPIRYPLTAQSTQTLAHAKRLAQDEEAKQTRLLVLHVNVIQFNGDVREAQLTYAIAPLLEDIPFSVITRQGFLVEEVILDEATQRDVDLIVVGKNHRPRWQRLLNRFLGNEPEVALYLREKTGSDVTVQVVE